MEIYWKEICFKEERLQEELTDKNVHLIRQFIEEKWEQVLAVYSPQMTAAQKYYTQVLGGCGKAAAVDIGWAGSGAMALSGNQYNA